MSRGRRGAPDACRRLGGRWALDLLGRRGDSCILTLLSVFRVAGVGNGGHRMCRARGFAWRVWGIVHAACVSRGRRGEWCDLLRRRASFCVAGAGAGNHAQQLKRLDYRVRMCEWMREASRNRGRRRESVDLWM